MLFKTRMEDSEFMKGFVTGEGRRHLRRFARSVHLRKKLLAKLALARPSGNSRKAADKSGRQGSLQLH